MIWIIVLVKVISGHLSYVELETQFQTKQECVAEFERLLSKYNDIGIPLSDMNGWCYHVEESTYHHVN